MNLTQTINKAVRKVWEGKATREILFTNSRVSGQNEFLFFLKPELTMDDQQISFEKILDMIFGKLDTFGLGLKNVILLPASYLGKHNIIAGHYGVINAIARNAKQNLNKNARDRFSELYQIDIEEADVLGGLEFADQYPDLTPDAIDFLWQNAPVKKLGGGAYCGEVSLDGRKLFLVNGFHPRQLAHFIAPGRSIVAMTLAGHTSWEKARNELIGKTNPAEALQGSIRQTLMENKDLYGLQAVSSSWNGVHLSAGPVEGLVELIRYNTDFDTGTKLTPADFTFGQKLIDLVGEVRTKQLLANPEVVFDGEKISVFDLTEEKDSTEALLILEKTI